MKASDCFLTILVFGKVYEGTSLVSQELHAEDDPDSAGGGQLTQPIDN